MLKGSHHSPESREKSRLAHLGKSPSPETRAKISAIHKGRQKSEIERQHLSEAHRRRSRESYDGLCALNRSEAKRAKQSVSLRGHTTSDETRAKISAKAVGNHRAVEAPIKGECVYCLRPAQTYDHMIPRGRPGWDDPQNIVPACYSCNTMKWTRTPDEWLADICAGRGSRDHRHPHE